MMQSLLSKDLLYPAMKDMNDKYPGWLADNRGNLSDEDYTKYNKQYDLTRRVCHEYAKEDEQSSEADKKATFERVMALMQVSFPRVLPQYKCFHRSFDMLNSNLSTFNTYLIYQNIYEISICFKEEIA